MPLPILEEQATKKIASGPTATAAVVVVVEEEEAEEEEEISQKLRGVSCLFVTAPKLFARVIFCFVYGRVFALNPQAQRRQARNTTLLNSRL